MRLGGLTEWLRSLIGNQVRCNSPVGSSPMSSAIIAGVNFHFRVCLFCWNFNASRSCYYLRISIDEVYSKRVDFDYT